MSICLFQMASQEVSNGQNIVDTRKIYDQTIEVNTLLKNGDNNEVILKANATIDSFPKLICRTPYFGYLNYYKGYSYRALGNYYLSEKCYAIADQCFLGTRDSIILIDSRINLASTLIVSKKYKEARILLERTLENFETSMSGDNKANIFSNLALIGMKVNDTILANIAFNKVIKLMESPSGGEFAHFITERNYGRYLMSQNRFDESAYFLKESLKGSIDSLGLTHFQTGLCYNHLGELFAGIADRDSASLFFTKALKILSSQTINKSAVKVNPQYETVLIECLLGYGGLLIKDISSYKEGFDLFQRAINRLLYLSHAVNDESTRFLLAEKGRDAFNKGVLTAYKLYKLTGNKSYFNTAFEWSLKAKSLSLNWLLEEDLIYAQVDLPTELTEGLNQQRKSLDLLLPRELDKAMALSMDSIGRLISLYEKTEEQIRAKYSDIMRETKELSFASLISESLGKRERYLGYLDADSILLAFTINKNKREIITIAKDSQLINSIDLFKNILNKTPGANYSQKDVDDFSRLSQFLFEKLVHPILKANDNILAIHPDGILLGFSFEALTSGRQGSKTFKGLAYLLKSHEIRYVATPFFSKQSKFNFKKTSRLGIITCETSEEASLIKSEVVAIQSKFPNSNIFYLNNFPIGLDKIISDHDAIHISSHVSINRQEFANSGLSCTSSDSNNYLTFQDIIYHGRSGKPVFINGCESGSGPVNQGEGLMSMGLAFAMSGSKSIIQHLWEASDQSSSELATNYYRHRVWQNESKALSKAKREYLRNCQHGYDHPYYWAGMVYYGSRDNDATFSLIISIILSGLALICLLVFLRKRFYA